MDAFLPYIIWAVLIIIGLSLLSILIFGIRGLTYGKADPLTIGAFFLPVVIAGVLTLVMDDWIEAAIATMLVMLGLAALALLLSGVRGVVG